MQSLKKRYSMPGIYILLVMLIGVGLAILAVIQKMQWLSLLPPIVILQLGFLVFTFLGGWLLIQALLSTIWNVYYKSRELQFIKTSQHAMLLMVVMWGLFFIVYLDDGKLSPLLIALTSVMLYFQLGKEYDVKANICELENEP